MFSVLMALSHDLVTIGKVMYSSAHRFVFVQGMDTGDYCSHCDDAGDVTRGLIIHVRNSVARLLLNRQKYGHIPRQQFDLQHFVQ